MNTAGDNQTRGASRIVIAPDSFKGSLSARKAANAIRRGLESKLPAATFSTVPLSDGGEGLIDAISQRADNVYHLEAEVTGPMGDPVNAEFCLLEPLVPGDHMTAVIEMASASGLTLVPEENRKPARATTYGTGQLIRAAMDAGATRIILGLGGSATVDGGVGCAQALGVSFLDVSGNAIEPCGAGLAKLDHIRWGNVDPRLRYTVIECICDVRNVLLGPEGAAATYGPNKGLSPEGVKWMEGNFQRLAKLIKRDVRLDIRHLPGGGAAGGMGAGLAAYLGATLGSGTERVLDTIEFDKTLRGASAVITGEGRFDGESRFGKVPSGVAQHAAHMGLPVYVLCGENRLSKEEAAAQGYANVWSIVRDGVDRQKAISNAASELEKLAAEIACEIQV